MKVRQGFVSNSSSSSFIVAVKGEFTRENLLRLFGINNGCLAMIMFNPLLDVILNSRDCEFAEHASSNGFDDLAEYMEKYPDDPYTLGAFLALGGWTVREFSVSSEDGDPVSNFFYQNDDIEIDEQDIKIIRAY